MQKFNIFIVLSRWYSTLKVGGIVTIQAAGVSNRPVEFLILALWRGRCVGLASQLAFSHRLDYLSLSFPIKWASSRLVTRHTHRSNRR